MEMLSPVRVRGRKTRKPKSITVKCNSGQPSKLSTSSSQGPTAKIPPSLSLGKVPTANKGSNPRKPTPRKVLRTHRLSSLELLPNEIIEQIFLCCPNVNLPRASPTIAFALSRQALYIHLIREVFQPYIKISHNSLVSPIEAGLLDDDPNNRALLQGLVLSFRWCTLPLLQRTQRKVTADFLRGLNLRKHYVMHENGYQSLEKFYREIENNISLVRSDTQSLCIELDCEPVGNNNFRSSNDPNDQITNFTRRFNISYDSIEGILYIKELQKLPSSSHSATSPPLPLQWKTTWLQGFTFPEISCPIPESILVGPWTDEKLDFLRFVIKGGAILDRSVGTYAESVTQGLSDAISECCEQAITLLCEKPLRQIPSNAQIKTVIVHQGCNERMVQLLASFRMDDDPSDELSYLGNTLAPLADDEEILAWAVGTRKRGDDKGQRIMDFLEGDLEALWDMVEDKRYVPRS
ncbi:MAG: hypothetical protein M1834_007412 [Cirrosporium novae-zelandiae]|nr:MAG: hypothetical protein M1834_007412 [Cirrosporium novae-zelandiae]